VPEDLTPQERLFLEIARQVGPLRALKGSRVASTWVDYDLAIQYNEALSQLGPERQEEEDLGPRKREQETEQANKGAPPAESGRALSGEDDP
jgi:hypothetical protein